LATRSSITEKVNKVVDNGKSKATGSRWSRWVTLIIFAISILPLVAAWWILEGLQEGGKFATRNYGELVTPARPLNDTVLKTWEGKNLAISELRGKWTLIIFGPAECDELCRENLYKTRQVRLAVGKDMRRVQRLWITNEVSSLGKQSWLREQHSDLLVASEGETKKGFVDQFVLPETSDPLKAQRVYVVDPIGNIVISYPPDEKAEHILKDLKRLLYVSQIG
jgi:cytochrome oxidase Cu insertion factor (SCO1/SenC/PrrC family)